jgi:hypothetical protein
MLHLLVQVPCLPGPPASPFLPDQPPSPTESAKTVSAEDVVYGRPLQCTSAANTEGFQNHNLSMQPFVQGCCRLAAMASIKPEIPINELAMRFFSLNSVDDQLNVALAGLIRE